VIVDPRLRVVFSSFAMRRSWVRIPSRPPDSKDAELNELAKLAN
jgi:hypothetical protein